MARAGLRVDESVLADFAREGLAFIAVRLSADSTTLVSGGAVAGNSRTGFAFQASASQVVLQYSTHSCADYYAARGAVAYQLCDDYVGVTPVDVGMPSDPICTVTLPTSYA